MSTDMNSEPLSDRQLFYAHAPKNLSEAGICEVFTKLGYTVDDLVLFKDTVGAQTSKGCGLVSLATQEQCDAAIAAMNGIHLWGLDQPAFCLRWSTRERQSSGGKVQRSIPCPTSGTVKRHGGPPRGCDKDAVKLFIGNLPLCVTEQDLRPLLKPQGDIIQLCIMRDRDTKVSLGYAFAWMRTRNQAMDVIKALNLNHILTDPAGQQPGPLLVRVARQDNGSGGDAQDQQGDVMNMNNGMPSMDARGCMSAPGTGPTYAHNNTGGLHLVADGSILMHTALSEALPSLTSSRRSSMVSNGLRSVNSSTSPGDGQHSSAGGLPPHLTGRLSHGNSSAASTAKAANIEVSQLDALINQLVDLKTAIQSGSSTPAGLPPTNPRYSGHHSARSHSESMMNSQSELKQGQHSRMSSSGFPGNLFAHNHKANTPTMPDLTAVASLLSQLSSGGGAAHTGMEPGSAHSQVMRSHNSMSGMVQQNTGNSNGNSPHDDDLRALLSVPLAGGMFNATGNSLLSNDNDVMSSASKSFMMSPSWSGNSSANTDGNRQRDLGFNNASPNQLNWPNGMPTPFTGLGSSSQDVNDALRSISDGLLLANAAAAAGNAGTATPNLMGGMPHILSTCMPKSSGSNNSNTVNSNNGCSDVLSLLSALQTLSQTSTSGLA